MNSMLRRATTPLAVALGLVVAGTAVDAVHDPVPQVDAQAAPAVRGTASDLATAFRSASQAALPGVAYIEVESAPRAVSQQVPRHHEGTPFEQFFRGSPAPQRPRMGNGSGFVISPDGYVLTNNHVVENASRVTVRLTDKREFEAEVVGRDPNTDVAVLKIEGKNLPTVRLGDPETLQVGDWVLALGYPLSLGETVTAGIVSAKGKSIGIMRQNRGAEAPLEHFIQTDAAINPGNSGGPLINLNGEVVGINSAIASPTGTYSGYGFAVPIHLAKRVADDLIRYGTVHRPRLGVQIGDVQPADVSVFGLSSARGSVVKVVPEGPAKDAGIQLGDVIVAVDGVPVKDTGDLMERIALRQPGEKVELELVRYGKRERATVKLDAFQAEPPARTASATRDADGVSRLGFVAAPATPELTRRLRINGARQGLIVTQVDPMGPAGEQLPAGMAIERLNGRPVRNLAELRAAAADLRNGSTVSIVGLLPTGERTIVNYRLHG